MRARALPVGDNVIAVYCIDVLTFCLSCCPGIVNVIFTTSCKHGIRVVMFCPNL